MRWLLRAAAVVALTTLTQIGGVVLLVVFALQRLIGGRGARAPLVAVTLFVVLYGLSTAFVVPPLAGLAGRTPLPCGMAGTLRTLPVLCALNRHYVHPELAALAEALATEMDRRFAGTTTVALDGNFPFFDGFPLLPHLSHDDGLKLDLAYYYADAEGRYLPGATRSPIGYWAFEAPADGEETPCPPVLATLRWDLSWIQPFFPDRPLEPERTRAALEWLFNEGPARGLGRVFIEPHLASRLHVASPFLGFQGCLAARHDDHIHIQMVEGA